MHSSVCVSRGQGLPSLHASWTIVRTLVDWPWPHVVEQAPKPKLGATDHSDETTQSSLTPAKHSSSCGATSAEASVASTAIDFSYVLCEVDV